MAKPEPKDELQSINESAALDVDGGEVPAAVAAAAGISPAEEWASCWAAIGMLVGGVLPEVRPAFAEVQCQIWGAAMAPVAAKYGWSVSAIGPELALAMASAPGVLAVGVAIARRKAIAKEGGGGVSGTAGAPSNVRADANASPMVRPA